MDSIRSEIKKYLQRERRKELPEGADFWEFDCKFGPDAEAAGVIHEFDIGKCISAAEKDQLRSFYVEILARPGYKTPPET